MAGFITKYVKGCDKCQRYCKDKHPTAQLILHEVPEGPWQLIGVDLIGPLPMSQGKDMILNVVDHYMKQIHLFPVKAPPMVGPTWTRAHFTLGSDCSLLLFQGTTSLCFLLHAFLIDRLRTSDVRWYRVVLVCRLLCSRFVYAPLRAVFLDHVYVHLHGSWYPMMDCTSHIYYGLFTPCLLMFHGVPYDSFTISYCTRFAVL